MADIYSILAGKGRGEDEYIRDVFGEPSHVNEVEKDAIDIYGLLGEMFTKNVGSGDTNPNTGLPEYDYKKNIRGEHKKLKNSPHNQGHDDYKTSGGRKGTRNSRDHKTAAQLIAEGKEKSLTASGEALLDPTTEENIDPVTGEPLTIGEMGLGQESLTAEQYQGMTPQEIVDDIFAKQYNNQVPPTMKNPDGTKMSIGQFKAQLAARLKNMPQFKGADPEALGFLEEGKALAEQKVSLTAQKQAGEVGAMGRSAYGGMGTGVRAGVGAGVGLAKTYGLGIETTDLAHREGVYGLEQQAGADWEADYSSFLGTLPPAA